MSETKQSDSQTTGLQLPGDTFQCPLCGAESWRLWFEQGVLKARCTMCENHQSDVSITRLYSTQSNLEGND